MDYGLAATVWTQDVSRLHRVSRSLQVHTSTYLSMYAVNQVLFVQEKKKIKFIRSYKYACYYVKKAKCESHQKKNVGLY